MNRDSMDKKTMELVRIFRRMGIRFVPVPVASDEEHAELLQTTETKLLTMLNGDKEGSDE